MPEYGTQVAPRDRWCIAAYIRALQLSQNATSAEIPSGQKVPSPPPQFRDIGNGATLPEIAPPTAAAEGEPK
jgi:DNA-directed RNA polymerase subunit K/omega